MRWHSACVACLLWVAACSSDGSAAGGGDSGGGSSSGSGSGPLGDVPSCSGASPMAVVKVQGTLDGQNVNVDQTPAAGGFSQLGTGQFDLPFGLTVGDAAVGDPGSVQIHLTWMGLIANGSAGAVTGTITLPTGSPLAGMSLCVGTGSKLSPDDANNGVDFVLDNLTLGPACTQAVTGEVRGCWGYTTTN